MNNVIFYSSHCPRCAILEKKLRQNNIVYEERNDVQEMLDKGMSMAPGLEVDGKIMGYKEAVEWINGKDKA